MGGTPTARGTGHAGDDGDAGDDDDYDDVDMAKKQRLLLFVKEAWKVCGYDDDLALETFHTHTVRTRKRQARPSRTRR